MAATFATFRDPVSRTFKRVKVGPSWIMMFFSAFFGIPLFYRGFSRVGTLMLGLCLSCILLLAAFIGWAAGLDYVSNEDGGVILAFSIAITLLYTGLTVLSLASGVLANKWTAVKYYKNGWKIIDAGSEPDKVKKIKMAWSLPDDAFDDTFAGLRANASYPGMK